MSEYKRFKYEGPTYYNGHKISSNTKLFTMARSFAEAERNFLYKIANGDYISRYDLVTPNISLVKEEPKEEKPKESPKCEICGRPLNTIGTCPVCDDGEEDY